MLVAAQPLAQRITRGGWQPAASSRQMSAALAQRSAGGMTEHRLRSGIDRRVAFGARVHRRGDAQLPQYAPRSCERNRTGFVRLGGADRVERGFDRLEQSSVPG